MADERALQAQEWGRNKWRLRQYSLRIKGLPPTFASSDRKVRASLCELIQPANTVPLLGAYTSENCLCGKGRQPHAFIYVGNAEDGNVLIQDMANTKIDGVRLKAEWSEKSRPNTAPLPHRLQAPDEMNISYWHPMEGEITQTQLQGTVPQTRDGPP